MNIRTLTGLAIASLFLWLALRQLDITHAREIVKHSNLGWVAAAFLLLILDYVLRSYRWLLMLRCFNPTLRLWDCSAPFWGSFAMNNILPLRAGDVLRIVAYSGRLHVNRTQIAGTLVVERVYDLTALFVSLTLALALLPVGEYTAKMHQLVTVAMVLAVTSAGITLLLPARVLLLLEYIKKHFQSGTFAAWLLQLIQNVFCGLVDMNRHASRSQLVVLTLGAWTLEGLVFICMLISLGVTPALEAGWLAMAAGTLSTLIPSSPGYAGTFDYFTAASLTVYGVSPSASVLAALAIHLVLWLPVTIIGGVMLWRSNGYRHLQQSRNKQVHDEI